MEVDAERKRLKAAQFKLETVKNIFLYLLSVHDDLGGSDANLVLWHFDK